MMSGWSVKRTYTRHPDSLYRLGTSEEGAVFIQELSQSGLADLLAAVVGTLPNLLNPDVPPILQRSMAPGLS